MKNLILDTCTWRNLLSESKNNFLQQLEFWHNNKQINFITHEKIIEEWDNSKKKHIDGIEKDLKLKYNNTKDVAIMEGLSLPEFFSPSLDKIKNQLKIIDKLINNSFKLKTSTDIKAYCADIQLKREAPFHNKINSMKDAYIIYSAAFYFSNKNQDFTFISDNHQDFSLKNQSKFEIHPDIQRKFENIKINYFSDIGWAIDSFKKELPILIQDEHESNLKQNKKNHNEYRIDKTLPTLDQLYKYLKFRHKELNYCPIPIFLNQYPFKLNSTPYYSLFNCSTDNKELVKLLQSFEIKDNKIFIKDKSTFIGIDNYFEKLEVIVKALTKNLIYSISCEETREKFNIKYVNEIDCSCPLCCLKKLKFNQCVTLPKNSTD